MYLFYDSRWDMVTGAQHSMLSLADGLRERHGISVTVASIGEGALLNRARGLGFRGERIGVFKVSTGTGRGGRFSRAVSQVGRLFSLILSIVGAGTSVLKNRPEVIYINDAYGVIVFGLWSSMLRVPIVYYVRSDKRIPFFSRLALRFSHKVFLVSDGVKKAFRSDELERYRGKTHVLMTGFRGESPIGVSQASAVEILEKELGVNLRWETPTFLLLGSYDPRKGHLEAIEAFALYAKVGRPGTLVFAGHDSYESYYREQLKMRASELGVSERVLMLEETAHPDYLLRLADIVILPSKCEGLPRVLIESLRQGTPAISFPVSGARMILSTEIEGTVTERADPSLLADAMGLWANKVAEEGVEPPLARIDSARRFEFAAFVDGFYVGVSRKD